MLHFFISRLILQHDDGQKNKKLRVLASKLSQKLLSFHIKPATTYPFCPFSCSQAADMATRRAKHAGSWYSSNARQLNSQLQKWLSSVDTVFRPARAIIAPHAGYIYCGPCGAHAYKQVDPTRVKRVFILGPSHHVHLTGCDLTSCSYYSTPLYDLEVDKTVNDELLKMGDFDMMSKSTDENEHSIELHLPYIAKVMESKRGQFTIVPVLVGSLTPAKERRYGEIFSKYIMSPENLFIISSDFCHWGKRFRFQHSDSRYHHIYESIEALDRKGMDLIERLDGTGFTDYIEEHKNTICGRFPIGVFLSAIRELRKLNGLTPKMSFSFLKYSQSNQCMSTEDTSVSYAAGVLLMS